MIIYNVYNTQGVKANGNAVMRTRNVPPATPHDVQSCSVWFDMWFMTSNQMTPEASHLRSPIGRNTEGCMQRGSSTGSMDD